MSYINPRVLDSGLSILTSEANRLHWCSAEPTSYALAVSLSLGNKASPTVGSPADRTPSGRKVTVSAISNGTCTATGTATHWALVDTVNSRLLATKTLAASQAVTNGDTITSAAFDIGIPGAV
jgi:hypothetical protein